MFTFIRLKCFTADRTDKLDLRISANNRGMFCPPQLTAFITAEFFQLAVRCLCDLFMTLQAETDIFAWFIERLNIMSLAVGFYRVGRNTELF